MRDLRARADVRGLAHVTGGGIAGNLARVLPDGLGAVVDPREWERPRVFAWLAEHGVPEDELRASSTSGSATARSCRPPTRGTRTS